MIPDSTCVERGELVSVLPAEEHHGDHAGEAVHFGAVVPALASASWELFLEPRPWVEYRGASFRNPNSVSRFDQLLPWEAARRGVHVALVVAAWIAVGAQHAAALVPLECGTPVVVRGLISDLEVRMAVSASETSL